jgi:hypothetical protein
MTGPAYCIRLRVAQGLGGLPGGYEGVRATSATACGDRLFFKRCSRRVVPFVISLRQARHPLELQDQP